MRETPTPCFIDADPYPWPFDGDLRPQNTALIVIDMQTDFCGIGGYVDRKSTRLNSSHANNSYDVFCLKKQHSLNTDHKLYLNPNVGARLLANAECQLMYLVTDTMCSRANPLQYLYLRFFF